MSNAAIYIHHDAYDTHVRRLMGRQSAGESFMRGYLRHAEVDRHYFWNAANAPTAELERMVARIEPPRRPIEWIAARNRPALAKAGVAHLPGPGLADEAWLRRPFGAAAYGLCGLTHTTATHRVMDGFADMLTAPVEPWDALICTSTAVRRSTEEQLDLIRQDLRERLGATRLASPMLVTIPLGVNAADYAPRPQSRREWRQRLDIPEDAIVAFYMGGGKMNPAVAAMVLQAAAERSARELYWIVAGWADSEEIGARVHTLTRALCPSVKYISVDGRPADVRFSIWSAGDFFVSLSDNIQETFGLTPVEAMAAGLPALVSDWDGYRDSVRHGVDGFRVRTYAPRRDLGRDLSYQYAAGQLNYDQYIASAAQMTAVDPHEAVQAATRLILDADLRRRMGAAGQRRAADVFDWSAVIPQYQALWAEQNASRQAAIRERVPMVGPVDNPRRPDPFRLFAAYLTEALKPADRVAVTPGLEWPAASERLSHDLAVMMSQVLPTLDEARQIFEALAQRGVLTVREISAGYGPRASIIERGLLWMLKFGAIVLIGRRELQVEVPEDPGTDPAE